MSNFPHFVVKMFLPLSISFKVRYESHQSDKHLFDKRKFDAALELENMPTIGFEDSDDAFDEDDITEPSDDVVSTHGGSGVYVFQDLTQHSKAELAQIEIFEKHLKSVDTEAIRKSMVHRELVRNLKSKPALIYYNRIPGPYL